MYQDVFILGARGKVGRTLVKQIYEKDDCNERLHKNPTRIVGLGEWDCFHFDSGGISEDSAEEFCNKNGSYRKTESLNYLLDFVLSKYSLSNERRSLVFADVTNAREEMGKFHLRVIKETPFGIVTSNKHPLVSCSFDEFQELTREPARYGYGCSVMAGAGIVDRLKLLRDVRDFPIKISGCFSGTLGYICTELEKGRKFSEIVAEARKLGYTEPHPADDLDGGDVERKIVILSRTAGFDVAKERVQRNSFIPEEYLAEKDIDKFMDSLIGLDRSFSERIVKVKVNKNVLRYVAEFDNSYEFPTISVGLKEVPMESQLGRLKGTLNRVVVRTRIENENPSDLGAIGAGLEITARNIRMDLVNLVKNRVLTPL